MSGDFAKDLEPITGMWVDQGAARHPEEFKRFFKTVTSSTAYYEDQMTKGLRTLEPKPEGDSVKFAKTTQGWGVRHSATAYGLGVNITYEAIRDGVALNQAQRILTELGRAAAELRNVRVHEILNNAFSATFQTGGDGKELCATDHPTDEGNTSNELATPTALSIASLKQMFIEMDAMKAIDGSPIKVDGQSLLIPRQLIFDANVIMKSAEDPTTSDRSVNPWGAAGMFKEIHVSRWLTSATKHFILTDRNERGLQFFERDPLTTFRDRDTDTMNAKFVVYTRFGRGWTDYNCIFGNAI